MRRRYRLVLAVTVDFAVIWLGLEIASRSTEAICNCNTSGLPVELLVTGLALATVGIFGFLRLYRHVLRFFDEHFLRDLMVAVALSAVVVGTGLHAAFPVPWAPLVLLSGVAILGPILTWRILATALLKMAHPVEGAPLVRAAVYGAGVAGALLGEKLRREPGYSLVTFVDDKPELWGRRLYGAEVTNPNRLRELVAAGALDQVIIAMPSASVSRRRELLNDLAELSVEVKTLPTIEEMISGRRSAEEVQPVRAEELLSREPVKPDLASIAHELKGQVVLVTGGGGSIGGALCREILSHGPRRLIPFDSSEFNLYTIDRELRALKQKGGYDVEVVPVLGSVLSAREIDRVLAEQSVDIIYHGAAYKHVPLVEGNPLQGMENNVLGTFTVAEAAIRHGVRKFVLISTDKAVRPSNVMGASKRFAEKIIQSLNETGCDTVLTLVRFGNVLDSAGSVVPLFRDQIRLGGPVTVTHPEVTRYFMTIPEAAELVIQAGAMSEDGGEVFHLDMGEPVRIADLARKMIHLSGYKVRGEGGDPAGIEIRYVGLRPGEKLYEELLIDGTGEPTRHPRIFHARDAIPAWADLKPQVEALRRAIEESDVDQVRRLLCDIVEDYRNNGAFARSGIPAPSAPAAE